MVLEENTTDNRKFIKKTRFEKEFKTRNAPLTDRLESNEDIKTIYNLFAIILISLLINTVIHDYYKTGRFHFGSRMITKGFNKLNVAIVIWCCYNFWAFASYLSFNVWAKIRILLKPKSIKSWDQIWLSLLVIYYCLSLYCLQRVVEMFEFAPCSATVLFLEEVRLLMKQYAFIRTNAPRVLSFKTHSDKRLILPNLQRFSYFLFAPTFVYRDEYPRTQNIRWKYVFYNLGEVLGIIWLLSLVVERFLVPHFEDICLRKYAVGEVVVPLLANSFPGILFIFGCFYAILHSSQNVFAEMLRFGDRMFYREWWTSRSLSEYYRNWNVVVHDWLFIYVYKDVYEILVPKNKFVARLAVFLLSAVVHEWILTNVLRLFLPVQFTQFFLAGAVLVLLNMLDAPLGNLSIMYLITFGSGVQVNMYTLEMFARKNCPLGANNTYLDFFKPRFITCSCIE